MYDKFYENSYVQLMNTMKAKGKTEECLAVIHIELPNLRMRRKHCTLYLTPPASKIPPQQHGKDRFFEVCLFTQGLLFQGVYSDYI